MPGQTAYTAWKEYSSAKKASTQCALLGAGALLIYVLIGRDSLRIHGCWSRRFDGHPTCKTRWVARHRLGRVG